MKIEYFDRGAKAELSEEEVKNCIKYDSIIFRDDNLNRLDEKERREVIRKKLVLLHTGANKLTGALLFLLPLSLGFLNISYTAVPLCALASFAAIQEGHFIRTGRDIS